MVLPSGLSVSCGEDMRVVCFVLCRMTRASNPNGDEFRDDPPLYLAW